MGYGRALHPLVRGHRPATDDAGECGEPESAHAFAPNSLSTTLVDDAGTARPVGAWLIDYWSTHDADGAPLRDAFGVEHVLHRFEPASAPGETPSADVRPQHAAAPDRDDTDADAGAALDDEALRDDDGDAIGPEAEGTVTDDEAAGAEAATEVADDAERGDAESAEDPAAGDVGGDLAMWRARVSASRQATLRAPATTPAALRSAPVRAVATRTANRERQRRGGAAAGARAEVPPSPDTGEGLPPPPPLPVPAAELAVSQASGNELPAQSMPAHQNFEHTKPDGTTRVYRPTIGARLPSGSGVQLAPAPAPDAVGEVEGAATVARVMAAGTEPATDQQSAPGLVLSTAPSPRSGAASGPPIERADITRVLGELQASAEHDSTEMVDGFRRGLYPDSALHDAFSDIGEAELVPDVKQRVDTAVATIASEAGIETADVQAAALAATAAVSEDAASTDAELTTAEDDTQQCVAQEGEDSSSAIAGAREGAEDAIDARAEEAEGGADPEAIRAKRDRLVARVNRRLAPEDVRYEREGAARLRALRLVEVGYTGGYQLLARQVVADDAPPAPAAPGESAPSSQDAPSGDAAPTTPQPSDRPARPVEQWAVDRVREVRTTFAEFRTATTTSTETHRTGITTARTTAREAIHAWAETEIGERSSWWDRLWDLFSTWRTDAKDVTEAWEQARNAQLLGDMQGDMGFVNDLVSGARGQQEMEAIGAMGGLSDAQQAIAAAYFAAPAGQRDPLSAIAAGTRVRIKEAVAPRILDELQRLLMAKPPSAWPEVAIVAQSEAGNVNIAERGRQFHAAVDQWGTDESGVYAALGGLSDLQRHAVDLYYRQEHGSSIDAELEDELSSSELDRAQDIMRGDVIAADAAALHTAIDGMGTDESTIWRVLRNKTPEERAELERIYEERYGESLQSALEGDLSGLELDRGEALRAGDVATADAIGLEHAQTATWYGGADTGEIQAIYATNRSEVEQAAAEHGWTSEEMNSQIVARNAAIEAAHAAEFSEPGDTSSLRDSFEANLDGAELDLALGLADNDMARADAARLDIERRSFVTTDDTVNEILESQYTRAQTEVRRDLSHDLANRRDLAAVRGEPFDEIAERHAMEGRIDNLAQERARGYMTALEERYDSEYSRWGTCGLQVLIAFNMSGSERDKARDLLIQGGRVSNEQAIGYAIDGAGTDLDGLRATLGRMSNEELAALPEDLKARIRSDVSGRDLFDIDLLLEGDPQTPTERLARARRQLEYENSSYAFGNLFSDDEREALERDVARLERDVEEYDQLQRELHLARLGFGEWTPEQQTEMERRSQFLDRNTEQGTRTVNSAVKEHRRSVDHLADTAAMIGAIVAAIVVTIVLEVGTVGGASPAVAAAWAAFAAATTTVVTKAALKGQAYSDEEILVDVVTGVVDVIAAVATAGVGNALLRVGKAVPASRLATMAANSSMTKRMVARGIAESAEGFVSSLPSAVAGTMADENTWRRGDPTTNLIMGIGMGAGMGTVMSGGMGSLGGIGRAVDVDAPRVGPDGIVDPVALARSLDDGIPPSAALDPPMRAAQWDAHRAENPSARYDDFLTELDAGRIRPDENAPPRFAQRMRHELGSGLPPGQRALVDDVPVDILSDADFRRLTRSNSGEAVTIIENGRPRILMREGADPHVLREEGLHAAQIFDRRLSRQVGLLDETNIRRWDDLPLNTRIEMYRAKLDLEIDANSTLARGLREQADAMPPNTARTALLGQAEAAQRNLGNLLDRRIELDSFGPWDRLRARFGRGPLAGRLEQPPRLFAKKAATLAPPSGSSAPLGSAAASVGPAPTKTAGAAPGSVAPTPAAKTAPLPSPEARAKGSAPRPKDDVTAAQRLDPQPLRALDPDNPLHSSPAAKNAQKVEQVGEPWHEQSVRSSGDTPTLDPGDLYRLVRVTQRDGTEDFFEETINRGTGRWVKRGSQSNRAGAIAEEASLAATQQRIRSGEPIATIGGANQNTSGQGFDEVFFRFEPDGTPRIILVEVKNYPNRYVPFDDFTATGPNLLQNLQRLARDLNGPRADLPPGIADLPQAQLAAIRKTINDAVAQIDGATKAGYKLHEIDIPELELEVRLAPGTKIGQQAGGVGTPTATRLADEFPGSVRVLGDHVDGTPTNGLITKDLMRDATGLVDAGLPTSADRSTVVEAFGRLLGLNTVKPRITAVNGEPKGRFFDATGTPSLIMAVTPSSVGWRRPRATRLLKRQAAQIAENAGQQVQRAGGAKRPLQIFVDVSSLDENALQRLQYHIRRELDRAGRLDVIDSINYISDIPPPFRRPPHGPSH